MINEKSKLNVVDIPAASRNSTFKLVNGVAVPNLNSPHAELNFGSTKVDPAPHVQEGPLGPLGAVESVGMLHVLGITFDFSFSVEARTGSLSNDSFGFLHAAPANEPPRA